MQQLVTDGKVQVQQQWAEIHSRGACFNCLFLCTSVFNDLFLNLYLGILLYELEISCENAVL